MFDLVTQIHGILENKTETFGVVTVEHIENKIFSHQECQETKQTFLFRSPK
jgi:hypothetical protein